MPYELELDKQLRDLWKVKIFDKERLEPPHVTIIRAGKREKWRWDLRKRIFMDKQPSPKELPKALIQILKDDETNAAFVCAWNKMFKDNPVEGFGAIKAGKTRKKKKR